MNDMNKKKKKIKIPPEEKEKIDPIERPKKEKKKDIDIEDSEDHIKEKFPTVERDQNKKIQPPDPRRK